MKTVRILLGTLVLAMATACAGPRLILVDHPLAGKVWDTASRSFLSPEEAERRIAAADIALLGEMHDNPAQHQIQARLLQAAINQGRRPALALEQIDSERQIPVDAVANSATPTPAAIAQAGQVSKGWEWRQYKPLVELALKERLPIVAANLSRTRARSLTTGGLAALGQGEAERLALDQEWTPGQNAIMRRLLVEGHCGQDNPMIDRLIHVQRSRDAVMADRILSSPSGSVVILGRAHARKDIGVPLYLRERGAGKQVLSLGMLEVNPNRAQATDYPDATPEVHDLIWFTPQNRRGNPCEGSGD